MRIRGIRHFVPMIFLATAGLGCMRLPADRPDIVIVTVDTLRYDRIGICGYENAETPTMDALLRRGTRFLNATTPMPRTTPALASMLTGLRPQHHGSREVRQCLSEATLLPQVLQRYGYSTLAVSASAAATPKLGLGEGFDTFHVAETHKKNAGSLTDAALKYVSQMPPDRPKLIWIHYIDPHTIYGPPNPWGDRPEAEIVRDTWQQLNGKDFSRGHLFDNRGNVASDALGACSSMYDAEIASTDAQLKRLLEGLAAYINLDGAVLLFTTDHGENLGEDGLYYEHGPSLHDASLHIPMGLSGPELPERTDSGAATLEDVTPTILDLVGVPQSDWPSMDGRSLYDRVIGMSTEVDDRIAVSESGSALPVYMSKWLHSGRVNGENCLNYEGFSLCAKQDGELWLFANNEDMMLTRDVSAEYPAIKLRLEKARQIWSPDETRYRAARTPRFKLVAKPFIEGGYTYSLYDLKNNPAETHDVSSQHPEEAARLRRALDESFRDVPHRDKPVGSAEDIRQLRALGYIQ